MNQIVEFKNVSKSFVTTKEITKVLDNLSFKINKGQIISIVGPSGCGKSTILNIIADLEKADEGEIFVQGKIGYMFQKDNLLSWRNVYDNITIGLEIQRKMNLENKAYIDKLLQKYISDSAELYNTHTDELPITTVGCVIGTHAGPGAIAVAFFEK
jgi:NitT/TauT family transport system ATP-binding protein